MSYAEQVAAELAVMGRPWRLWAQTGGGIRLWVIVPAESSKVLGWVRRHVVTPGERFEWGAARPRGGDWVAEPTYTAGQMTIHRTRADAAQALYDLWACDAPDHPGRRRRGPAQDGPHGGRAGGRRCVRRLLPDAALGDR